MGMMESMNGLGQNIVAALKSGPSWQPAALRADEGPNPLEVDLGDGNTFADLMGCGIAIVEQVDRTTGETHRLVLTRDSIERLLAALI